MNHHHTASWLLRIGLAFVFAYASIEIYVNPQNFLKYTPTFIFDLVPVQTFLFIFGALELLLSIWILTKWKSEYAAVISVMLMLGIILFNMEHFQILFRNVAIAFGGLALLSLETKKDDSSNACFES